MLTQASNQNESSGPESGIRQKNPAAVALGKLGASKGGNARARSLTAEQKVTIARLGAEARWSRENNKQP
jgi:hypothetical protein